MRTTLGLEVDAVDAIQAYAKSRQLSLGRAASELVRRGARYELTTRRLNGLPVLDAPDDFPLIASARMRELGWRRRRFSHLRLWREGTGGWRLEEPSPATERSLRVRDFLPRGTNEVVPRAIVFLV